MNTIREIVSEIEDIIDEPETTYHQSGTTDLYDPFSPPTTNDDVMEDLEILDTNDHYDPASPDMDVDDSSDDQSPGGSPKILYASQVCDNEVMSPSLPLLEQGRNDIINAKPNQKTL